MHLLKTDKLTIKIAEKNILDDLDLIIQPGDLWGLLGPNGCGKTTLLNTLAGLHPRAAGEIYLQENNLQSCSRKKIAKKIGILFQDTSFIFPQSVFEFCENSRHPHKRSPQDQHIIVNALAAMEIDHLATKRVDSLSGGEKRRLAIAAVLTQTPQIYLLDEPTNHLDVRHQIHVLNHFKKLSETSDIGIMMSIHDLNLVEHYCNKVLMLFDNGEILQGTTEDILTSENISRLYNYPVKTLLSETRKIFYYHDEYHL